MTGGGGDQVCERSGKEGKKKVGGRPERWATGHVDVILSLILSDQADAVDA